MSASQELVDLLVCPQSRGKLEWVDLPQVAQERLADKYREHFDGEEPMVAKGLLCRDSQLVYPVVADIPIMLVEEALPASVLDES